MFLRFTSVSTLIAVGLLGTFFAPQPVAAQQGQNLYEWSGHYGRFSAGSSYRSGFGGSYYQAPRSFYATPGSSESAPSRAVGAYQAFYPPPEASGFADADANRPVWVTVRVPSDAAIWFGDTKTVQKGELRYFVSPPVSPGHDYFYEIKAKWTEAGKEVVRIRHVSVRAGDLMNVSF
jgi:uncharacterized protein (TIGR03000 family)